MGYISAAELHNALKSGENYLIIDIREPYEYSSCNIGSLHIPMGEVTTRLNELPEDKTLVIMCRSGKRAEAVANLLRSDLGFTNTVYLEGGILAWRDQVDQTLDLD